MMKELILGSVLATFCMDAAIAGGLAEPTEEYKISSTSYVSSPFTGNRFKVGAARVVGGGFSLDGSLSYEDESVGGLLTNFGLDGSLTSVGVAGRFELFETGILFGAELDHYFGDVAGGRVYSDSVEDITGQVEVDFAFSDMTTLGLEIGTDRLTESRQFYLGVEAGMAHANVHLDGSVSITDGEQYESIGDSVDDEMVGHYFGAEMAYAFDYNLSLAGSVRQYEFIGEDSGSAEGVTALAEALADPVIVAIEVSYSF